MKTKIATINCKETAAAAKRLLEAAALLRQASDANHVTALAILGGGDQIRARFETAIGRPMATRDCEVDDSDVAMVLGHLGDRDDTTIVLRHDGHNITITGGSGKLLATIAA